MKQEASPERALHPRGEKQSPLERETAIEALSRQGIPLREICRQTGLPLETVLHHLWSADLRRQLAAIAQGRVPSLSQPATLTFAAAQQALCEGEVPDPWEYGPHREEGPPFPAKR